MNVNKFIDVLEEVSMVSLFSPIKVIIVNNFIRIVIVKVL